MSFEKCGTGGCGGVPALFYTGTRGDRFSDNVCADFGISILREYWGQGIGAALTGACIDCAKEAGFWQLELEVVGDNENAVRLYKRYGFMEYGRNPRGFLTRDGRWQELVLMRLELEDAGARKNDAGNGESDVF